ncbi:MAG: competence type IV pilus minor pilin ComGE [Streptococcus minor]|nr:competence type IV pilus minor pilin ComGE [Streptococcus minor]
MVVIKKQKLKAYILLESLSTLAVFVMITSLLLTAIHQGRNRQIEDYEQQEVLNLAKMAVQTGQSQLSLNGVEVHVVENEQEIKVYHKNKEILHVEKN